MTSGLLGKSANLSLLFMIFYFNQNFAEVCLQEPNWQEVSIGSDHGLAISLLKPLSETMITKFADVFFSSLNFHEMAWQIFFIATFAYPILQTTFAFYLQFYGKFVSGSSEIFARTLCHNSLAVAGYLRVSVDLLAGSGTMARLIFRRIWITTAWFPMLTYVGLWYTTAGPTMTMAMTMTMKTSLSPKF